jgi:hypothetical protein
MISDGCRSGKVDHIASLLVSSYTSSSFRFQRNPCAVLHVRAGVLFEAVVVAGPRPAVPAAVASLSFGFGRCGRFDTSLDFSLQCRPWGLSTVCEQCLSLVRPGFGEAVEGLFVKACCLTVGSVTRGPANSFGGSQVVLLFRGGALGVRAMASVGVYRDASAGQLFGGEPRGLQDLSGRV